MQEVRQQILADNPDAKFADVGRVVGQRWATLPDEQKKVWLRAGGRRPARRPPRRRKKPAPRSLGG
jgi:hypothetical protein